MKKWIFLFLLLTCFGCAHVPLLPPITSSSNFVLGDDERRLWDNSRQSEKNIEERNLIFNDPELDAYLDKIARKLQPPAVFEKIPFKIKIVKDRRINAFAFPNGFILIHTGILSRMENEAQLSMLLAHEMTHATHRHMVNEMRKMRNIDFIMVSQIAYSGYSKELETEADTIGFKLMVKAGYDPREGMSLYEYLKERIEEEKINEPFFLGTHPYVQDRINNLEKLVSQYTHEKKKSDNTVFLKKIHNVVLENGELSLDAGQLKQAEREAEKSLKIIPGNAKAYMLLGKINKKKGDAESLKKAQNFFDQAIASDSAYPEPYREKGLMHMKKGEKDKARIALMKYVTHSDNPSDKKLIEEYIRQCSEGDRK